MSAPWAVFPGDDKSYLVTKEIELNGQQCKLQADVRVAAPDELQARKAAEIHFWAMVKQMAEAE